MLSLKKQTRQSDASQSNCPLAIQESIVTEETGRRHRRWGLYLPFLGVALLAAGWSAFWFVARDRVVATLDAWVAREADLGRRWTCPERAVGGFPFRFELICARPSFTGTTPGGPVEGSLARLLVAAQVYDPSLVIAEAEGPFIARAAAAGGAVRLDWTGLRASVRGREGSFERASFDLTGGALRLGAEGESPVVQGERLEAHVRRDPARPPADDAYELALTLTGSEVPALDGLIGGAEPADAEIRATITRAGTLGRGRRIEQLERWRDAGGRLDIARLAVTKGSRRLEAKASLSLDERRRPQGVIDASAAGLDDLLARFGGRQSALGGLIAGGLDILGGRRRGEPPAAAADAGLTRLPPIRIVDGKGYLGPIPLFLVPPLY